MNPKASGVAALLGGVALIYLAYTGYLDSAWKGLRGDCSGAGTRNDASPAESTPARDGIGAGGQADVGASAAGTFYPGTTGALMAGDGAAW